MSKGKRRDFYVAVTKTERGFASNSLDDLKQQVQDIGMCLHNAAFFLCQKRNGNTKIKKKLICKKPHFKLSSAHEEILNKTCRSFLAA